MKIHTERLKELRNEKGVNQIQIAKALRCGQTTYSQYELKKRDIPTDVLCELANYFETSTDYLLGQTDKRKPYPPVKED